MNTNQLSVAVLCGGVGAARFLTGLLQVVPAANVTAIVNTADDMVLHGLSISPDLDTCTYTLAGQINHETGWGLTGETWQARSVLDLYGGESWFGLGDRDLGTHLYRTQRLSEGATLTEVTAEIAQAWGLELNILPMTDDTVRTRITLDTDETIDFQRYFVERRHADPVKAVHFDGADQATPSAAVLRAIDTCDVVVIAPSNPIVSIAPVLSLGGLREQVAARRRSTVVVSPIIGGSAVKGPAADLLRSLGHEVSAVGVAAIYADVAAHIVIDTADAELAARCREFDVTPTVTNTMMTEPDVAAHLAQVAIDAATHRG